MDSPSFALDAHILQETTRIARLAEQLSDRRRFAVVYALSSLDWVPMDRIGHNDLTGDERRQVLEQLLEEGWVKKRMSLRRAEYQLADDSVRRLLQIAMDLVAARGSVED